MNPKSSTIQESGDSWVLPVIGQQVTRCCIDYAEVNLLLANGINVNISEPFVYVDPDGAEFRLDPEGEGVLLAPILRLKKVHAKSGIAFKNGWLRMLFEDNSQIEVPPSRDYEAWNVNGGDGLLIVSVPGGDLSIWGALDYGIGNECDPPEISDINT